VNDRLRAIKPAVFVGSSQKDLKAFPAAVRGEIGQSLFEAQLGEHPRNAKPLKGFSGVLEIRDNFDGDTYRAVYTVRLEGVLKRDEIGSNRHRALASCLGMIFSENRFTLFRIMPCTSCTRFKRNRRGG